MSARTTSLLGLMQVSVLLSVFAVSSTIFQDIFSFNVEQSRGDTHNMIVIHMKHDNMTLQAAVDYVGNLCAQTIDSFVENRSKVPSWGPEIDEMVQRYIVGLQDWIVGWVVPSCTTLAYLLSCHSSLHWSFMTHRYFGTEGATVKESKVVTLLPRTE